MQLMSKMYKVPIQKLTIVILLTMLLLVPWLTTHAGTDVKVVFRYYADGTTVSQLSVPYITFTTNGTGTAQVYQGKLRLQGNITLVISLAVPASHLKIDYEVNADCSGKYSILALNDEASVDNVQYGNCDKVTTYEKLATVTKFGIMFNGRPNTPDALFVDDFELTLPDS